MYKWLSAGGLENIWEARLWVELKRGPCGWTAHVVRACVWRVWSMWVDGARGPRSAPSQTPWGLHGSEGRAQTLCMQIVLSRTLAGLLEHETKMGCKEPHGALLGSYSPGFTECTGLSVQPFKASVYARKFNTAFRDEAAQGESSVTSQGRSAAAQNHGGAAQHEDVPARMWGRAKLRSTGLPAATPMPPRITAVTSPRRGPRLHRDGEGVTPTASSVNLILCLKSVASLPTCPRHQFSQLMAKTNSRCTLLTHLHSPTPRF